MICQENHQRQLMTPWRAGNENTSIQRKIVNRRQPGLGRLETVMTSSCATLCTLLQQVVGRIHGARLRVIVAAITHSERV